MVMLVAPLNPVAANEKRPRTTRGLKSLLRGGVASGHPDPLASLMQTSADTRMDDAMLSRPLDGPSQEKF